MTSEKTYKVKFNKQSIIYYIEDGYINATLETDNFSPILLKGKNSQKVDSIELAAPGILKFKVSVSPNMSKKDCREKLNICLKSILT